MVLAPFVAPHAFPATAIDGTSTRALWVQVMGIVQASLGGGFLLRELSRLGQESFAQALSQLRRPQASVVSVRSTSGQVA